MSLVKNIETKFKLAFFVSIASFVTSIIICILAFNQSGKLIESERQKIYVLDNNVPIVAQRTNILDNRKAEYIANIQTFHDLFFSLPPDNQFIEKQLQRAMYLIDASGVSQYNTLKEKGYFTSIVSTSSVITSTSDSINIDLNTKKWTYYGKVKIERPSMTTIRSLITTGNYVDVPRTDRNSHGMLLTSWKIIENKDIESYEKKIF